MVTTYEQTLSATGITLPTTTKELPKLIDTISTTIITPTNQINKTITLSAIGVSYQQTLIQKLLFVQSISLPLTTIHVKIKLALKAIGRASNTKRLYKTIGKNFNLHPKLMKLTSHFRTLSIQITPARALKKRVKTTLHIHGTTITQLFKRHNHILHQHAQGIITSLRKTSKKLSIREITRRTITRQTNLLQTLQATSIITTLRHHARTISTTAIANTLSTISHRIKLTATALGNPLTLRQIEKTLYIKETTRILQSKYFWISLTVQTGLARITKQYVRTLNTIAIAIPTKDKLIRKFMKNTVITAIHLHLWHQWTNIINHPKNASTDLHQDETFDTTIHQDESFNSDID